jgi:DNA polymerase III delta prime subunit
MGEVAKHVCTNILDVEGIKYDIKEVAALIKDSYPDIRSIIKNLQAGTKDNQFTFTVSSTDWLNKLVEVLASRDKKAWYIIRQLVADAQVDDFQTSYRFLF